MQFGVSIPHYGGPFSVDSLRRVVQRAEELGYDSAWVGDHIVTPDRFAAAVGPHFYDAFVVLSHVAAFTQRLRLGTSVIVLPYRSPLAVAKTVATLDAMSGGRVVLGIGAGNAPDEFKALGIPEAGRGRRTDEYLQAMIALWTQEPASFTGNYVDFQSVHFEPKPAQKPHPPIWVGGHSKAALRRAVRFGEAWHSGGMAHDRMAETVSALRRLAQDAGRTDGPAVTTRLTVRFLGGQGEDRRPGRGSPRQVREDLTRYRSLGVSFVVCDFGPRLGDELVHAMTQFKEKVAEGLD